jgi:hypothetical protein
MNRDETPCYVPLCPECRGVFGAAVADLDDAVTMQQAIKARRGWERAGLQIEVWTVERFRQSRAELYHRETCSKYPAQVRALKRPRQRQTKLAL